MKDLICNQRRIPKEQWRYGLRSSSATGCGWIATYNALKLLGYRAEPEELIRYYERMLPLVHGNLGTSVLAPALCFRQWGFPVETEVRRDRFDDLAGKSDVCILFYHWRKGWKFGAHFIAVEKTNGGFTGYNVFRSSTGPEALGNSLEQFLTEHGYFGAALIGIRNQRV